MLSANNKISPWQFQLMLILDILGVGLLRLPRDVSAASGQDGWLCVVIGAFAAVLSAFLIVKTAARFPLDSFSEYSALLLGKPLGAAVALGLAVRLILAVGLQLRVFNALVHEALLPKTPSWVVLAVILAVSAYAARKGLEVRARVAELLVFLVILQIFFVCAVVAMQADFTNLAPTLVHSPRSILSGGYPAFFAFTGVEFCYAAVFYVSKPKKAAKAATLAVAAIGLIMFAVTVIALARYSPAQMAEIRWPIPEMADAVSLPGSFLERQGALVACFWIISVFAFTSAGLFFASAILKDLFRAGKRRVYVTAIIPVVFAISILPESIVGGERLQNALNATFGIAYLIALPILFFIISRFKKGDKLNETKA